VPACLRAAWVEWAAWAEWTTKPSAYWLAKAINNSRVPKGARLFWFSGVLNNGRLCGTRRTSYDVPNEQGRRSQAQAVI
jgi:hypothetical protein